MFISRFLPQPVKGAYAVGIDESASEGPVMAVSFFPSGAPLLALDEHILESIFFLRYSASRQMKGIVEASGRLLAKEMQARLRGTAGLFRVRKIALPRRGIDALPAKEASIDRP
jgi:hypothetical protein